MFVEQPIAWPRSVNNILTVDWTTTLCNCYQGPRRFGESQGLQQIAQTQIHKQADEHCKFEVA